MQQRRIPMASLNSEGVAASELLEPDPSPEEVEFAVREHANSVVSQGSTRAAITNVLLAVLLVAGNDGALRSAWIWAWLGALSFVYGLRVALARRFAAAPSAAQHRDTALWRRRFIRSATLGGLCWAPGVGMLWALSQPEDRFLILLAIGGMLPAVTATLSAIPTAMVGYLLPIWLVAGVALAVTAQKVSHFVAAFFSLALVPLLRQATRVIHDEFRRAIRSNLEQQRLLRQLERARDAALASAGARSEFLSVMSHELRTPLNGVVGLTRLLADTPLDADQRELAQDAQTSAQMLLELINGVLDLSRLDAGGVELEAVDFELRVELERLRRLFEPRAREKHLQLRFEVQHGVSARVRGDWFRLRQVLVNLVGNALKFTDRGTVWCRVVAAAPADASVPLRFEVEDTGIGLAPEQRERLFQPFAQADASTTRRFGGTGLGLNISMRLVALMGGELQVESSPGVGSRFWFEVSLAPPAAEAAPEAPAKNPTPAPGHRVLVCDDNEINLKVASRLLERAGYQVEVRRNGAQALEAMASARFDAVLMDLQMPVMDGYEALRRTRAPDSLVLDRAVPMVALTASASAEDRDACQAAGFEAFLTKPIEAGQLVSTLQSLCAGDGALATDRGGAAPEPRRTP
jgi:signal transduction histidine kinase/CheY-like chemotaxis protein